MAYKTISNLRDGVSSILQGLNLNNVKNPNMAFERVARQVCGRIDIPEASGRLAQTLYDGVIDYPYISSIFGANVIDIQPQGVTRNANDYVYKNPIEQFDRTKGYLSNGTMITFEYRNGTPVMRIVSTRPMPRIELDPLSATTGWTAAGSASSLTLDSTVFYQDPGSLRFTLTGASVGTLTKSIPSNDLTAYGGVGVVFLAIRTPDATNLTSIEIRIGSDASNYYSVSNTTGFLGAWTTNEWLLVSFNLSGATTVGTPVITAIDYAQIRVTHGATITNFYVGDLWIALPSPHFILYQSTAIFLATGGSPSQTITNNSDQIILNDAAYAIYELECASEIAQQQGGTLGTGVIQTIDNELFGVRARNGMIVQLGLYDLYRSSNPSEVIRQINSYY